MNDPGSKAKQQIIEKLKSATNILVTVSRDPTVDDLSAAIGLTVMLNNMGKHATAIFSGAIPPAITFLEPDKVFEGTADSLRDFIIALDKEKADHLRYKLDGDVVKIFITPYKTTISSSDLEFSQGDFNVEIILALGVANKDHLDGAIAAHGQIMKDVTVATLSTGDSTSELGSIAWHEDEASSLSELIVSLSDSLKTDKNLLDKQISTALLTGIVFATDRFSNTRTNAKVMTMAAQLMAAGADQQLIAARLNESHNLKPSTVVGSVKNISEEDGLIDMPIEGESAPVEDEVKPATESNSGDLQISHEEEVVPSSTLPPETESSSVPESKIEEPLLGGTLNATADQAEEENRRQQEDKKNKTILTHSYLAGSEPNVSTAINSNTQPSLQSQDNIDIFSSSAEQSIIDRPDEVKEDQTPQSTMPVAEQTAEANDSSTLPTPTIGPIESVEQLDNGAVATLANEVSTLPPSPVVDSRDSEEAKLAVESALGGIATLPAPAVPTDDNIGLPLPPPLPDFSSSTLPDEPTPFDYSAASLASPTMPNLAPVATDDNPANFKIPG